MGHPEGQPASACAQWTQHPVATTGAPEAFCGATSARRGSGTRGANPGAHIVRRLCSSTLRGPCTQWATTGPLMRSVEPPLRALNLLRDSSGALLAH